MDDLQERTSGRGLRVRCACCLRPAGCSLALAQHMGWRWWGIDWMCPDCLKTPRKIWTSLYGI